MPIAAGSKLGPYEIVGPLGAGGMGEVYRAKDTRLGREVAIKVLPTSFADHPDRLARFEGEARAAGQLNHPNVLTVLDVGTEGGAPYLVMELLEGATLRERLEEGAPPPRKALEWASQIALGLAAAHEKGIVHRDLKPENVFITRDGRVKILDFGLARMVAGPSGSGSAALTALQATDPGTILGTVGYMSPEQVRGQPADARSDVFAVGVTLYEMLAGRRAFQRESPAETMAAILKEEPPELAETGRHVPMAADRIVRRCLEKRPEERFQSARDLAFALDAISGSSTSSSSQVAVAGPAPAPPRRSMSLTVGLAAVAVALGLGYLIGHVGRASPVVAPVTLEQLNFDGGNSREPALAPDGASFVFVSDRAGHDDIYLERVGGDNPINLTKASPSNNAAPAFSPDGKLIAFRSDRDGGGIFVMGATGESVRRLTDVGFNPAWLPDSSGLLYSTEGVSNPSSRSFTAALWRVDLASGTRTKVYDGDAVQPSVSPDGQHVAFWGLPPGTGRRVIYTMPIGGGPPVALVDDHAVNWSPKWAPDGRAIYFASDRARPMGLWRLAVDPTTGRAAGEPTLVASGTEDYLGLSEAAGGAFVFPSTTTTVAVERASIDPRAAKLLGPPAVLFRTGRVLSALNASPDGQFLVMTVAGEADDLMVSKTDGSDASRLTNAGRNRGPVWTPDSGRLYFYSDRGGHYEIWTIRRDGSGLEQVTHQPPTTTLAEPRLSPDGHTLSVNTTSRVGLLTLTGPGAEPTLTWPDLPKGQEFYAVAWSADGHALVGNAMDHPGSIVYSLADRSATALANLSPIAMPDEHTVLGTRPNDDHLVTVDVKTGAAKTGDLLPGRIVDGPVLSPDGHWLYFIVGQTVSHIWLLTVAPAVHK